MATSPVSDGGSPFVGPPAGMASQHSTLPLLLGGGRWILAAALMGFAVSAIAGQVLELPRAWVIFALAGTSGILAMAYVRSTALDLGPLISHHWVWAIVRGVGVGVALIVLALPHDPTPTPDNPELAYRIVWLGVVSGVAESLLVNIVPMMAVWRAFRSAGLAVTIPGKVAASATTVGANLFVTAAYSLGFPEFRGAELAGPAGTNFLIGMGFVFAPNPLISIISHVIIHVASVLAGTDNPVHLPPHY